MTEYSVAEAKNNLPKLLDRMLAGEPVTITRRGRPVAQIVPVEKEAQPKVPVDLEWLKALREAGQTPTSGQIDTVRAMRDAYRY